MKITFLILFLSCLAVGQNEVIPWPPRETYVPGYGFNPPSKPDTTYSDSNFTWEGHRRFRQFRFYRFNDYPDTVISYNTGRPQKAEPLKEKAPQSIFAIDKSFDLAAFEHDLDSVLRQSRIVSLDSLAEWWSQYEGYCLEIAENQRHARWIEPGLRGFMDFLKRKRGR